MRRCYQLGGLSFQSKDLIRRHVRQFIASRPIGAPVADPVLVDLLQKHPGWEAKSSGMTGLVIGEVEVTHARTKCKTVVIAKPGGYVDITWSMLIDRLQHDGSLRHVDERSENLFKIKVAARAAIQHQILEVDKTPGDHVDHIYPRTFDRLLFLFLKWWDVPIADIRVSDPAGLKYQPKFECWDLETNWQIFHGKLARLRAVPAAVNMAAPVYPVDWSVLP